MTVSCSLSLMWRCSPPAIRCSALTRFALDTGTDHHDFLVFHVGDAGDRHERALRDSHKAVADRHFQRTDHAAAVHGHLLVVVHGGVDDHLDAVHVGREQADKDPARRIVHDIDEALFDG